MSTVTMWSPSTGSFVYNQDSGLALPPGARQTSDHNTTGTILVNHDPAPSNVPVYHQPPSSSGESSGYSYGLMTPGKIGAGGYYEPPHPITSYDPAAVAAQAQAAAAAAAAQAAAQATAARNARIAEKHNNNVWSNDAGIRSLEERSWDIYVDTGRWDTPEQIQYHKQAEDMRKALNPMYQGSGPAGPITQGDQNKISLPNVPADAALGKIVTIGGLAVGAMVLLAMVKG